MINDRKILIKKHFFKTFPTTQIYCVHPPYLYTINKKQTQTELINNNHCYKNTRHRQFLFPYFQCTLLSAFSGEVAQMVEQQNF